MRYFSQKAAFVLPLVHPRDMDLGLVCGESSSSSSNTAASMFPMIIEVPVDAEGEMVGDLTTVLGIGTSIGVAATGRALSIQQILDATSARCAIVLFHLLNICAVPMDKFAADHLLLLLLLFVFLFLIIMPDGLQLVLTQSAPETLQQDVLAVLKRSLEGSWIRGTASSCPRNKVLYDGGVVVVWLWWCGWGCAAINQFSSCLNRSCLARS